MTHHYEEDYGNYSLDPLKKTYHFYTDGLLSKWGFGDGDMLNGLCGARSHDDLSLFVEKVIVPQITNHKITTYRIHTSHNPIRAKTIDGIEALYPSDDRFMLLPECFSYTGQEILDALEKMEDEQ